MKYFHNTSVRFALALSLGMIALSGSFTAHAQAPSAVTLKTVALVERSEQGPNGQQQATLKAPSETSVVPGDIVVFKTSYENSGAVAVDGVVAENKMPKVVQFVDVDSDWADVSIDGGKSWGKLGQLMLTERINEAAKYDAQTGAKISDAVSKEVSRSAKAEDVTHVRWVFAKPLAPGEKGIVSYRGRIR